MLKLGGPKLLLIVPVSVATLIVGWALLLPIIVQARAASIASGKSYCFQVTGERLDYRPVTSWFDLTAFAMRVPFESAGGSNDPQWTFHAVLVVESELYNWSHMTMNFEPVSSDVERALHLQPRCVPAH